jgi:hypothetical protein
MVATINQEKVFENTLPDPTPTLRIAFVLICVIAAYVVVLGLVMPTYAYVFWAVLLPLAFSWQHLRRVLRDEDDDFRNQFVSRSTIVEFPKIHPDELKVMFADLKLPPGQRKGPWERCPFPPSETVFSSETIHPPQGKIRTEQFVRHRLADAQPGRSDGPEQSRAMGIYLKRTCPELYRHVQRWWLEHHVEPLVSIRWPGKSYRELQPTDQKAVNQILECEFLQGIFIALRPETWQRGRDVRPYFCTHYALRAHLDRNLGAKERPTPAIIAAAPWPMRFRTNWIYLGEGYLIDERDAQKIHFRSFGPRYPSRRWLEDQGVEGDAGETLKGHHKLRRIWLIGRPLAWLHIRLRLRISRKFRDMVTLALDDAKETGARWILGIGWRKQRSVWMHYDKDRKQHTAIFGASGYGKTVCMVGIMIHDIYRGAALIDLDPKGDKDTYNLIAYHTERAGRLDDLEFMSISRGDLPINSTFNPISGYTDPSQIGGVLAGLMPEDAGSNQAFLDDARDIGRILGTTVHWLNRWMAALSEGRDVSIEPPRLLLWLEFARLHGLHEVPAGRSEEQHAELVAQRLAEFDAIHQRLHQEDHKFTPQDSYESTLFTMWLQKEYTARYWKLHFGHLEEFALKSRWRLFSWGMRLVYPYVCSTDPRMQGVLFPLSDTHGLVAGENVANPRSPKASTEPSLIQVYERSGPHILAPNGLVNAERSKVLWSYLYEVAMPVDRLHELQLILNEFNKAWNGLITQCMRSAEEFGNGVFNLRPVVNELIAGRKFEQLCVAEPRLTWPVICEEKKVVIWALGSLSDAKASDAVSKGITQGLCGWIGFNQDGEQRDLDVSFNGDEFLSWGNATFVNVVDKGRSSGVRTTVPCQSEAGMRWGMGSGDLYKHMRTNQRNQFTCNTPNEEDQKPFVDGLGVVQVLSPDRNTSEQPSEGSSGNKNNAEWATSEGWSWKPQEKPYVNASLLGYLPVGVFMRRVQDQLHVFQAPRYREPQFPFHLAIGLKRIEGLKIAGVDYDVRANIDAERMRSWGNANRIGVGKTKVDLVDIDAGELAAGHRVSPAATAAAQAKLAADGTDIEFLAELEREAVKAKTSATSATPPAVMKPWSGVSCDDLDADFENQVTAMIVDHEQRGTAIATMQGAAAAAVAAFTLPGAPALDSCPPAADSLDAPGFGISFGDDTPTESSPDSLSAAPDDADLPLVEELDGPMVLRGHRSEAGLREGVWECRTDDGILAAIMRYRNGKLNGSVDKFDDSGRVVERLHFLDDVKLSEEIIDPPVEETHRDPPGPIPLGIVVTQPDDGGLIAEGALHAGKRFGTWIVRQADGTKAEIQHYHSETGKPVGKWERYDDDGDFAGTFDPETDEP